MFTKKLKAIVVVHNDTLFWIGCTPSETGRCLLQISLEEVLADADLSDRLPAGITGGHQSLWIVPDHWFGMESYPFQSDKSSLIVPFLERKLGAAHPECPAVRHFYGYRCTKAAAGGYELLAYFLQDEKAYRLYEALDKARLSPRYITSPAFVWLDRLSRLQPDFGQEGTLLIHMGQGECQLYFYINGNYLFSRNVILAEGPDRLEALTFEINQSLYMFSQKTKSELSRVYLLAAGAEGAQTFSETLGREVVDLTPLVAQSAAVEVDELPLLKGLLSAADTFSRPPAFSVTHREVKRELAWQPIQSAGIAVGAALLLPLLGLNLMLGQMLRGEAADGNNIRRQAISHATTLTEYQSALDQVIQARQRPECLAAVRRVLASLPAGMQVRELDVALEEAPAVTLKAVFAAEDAERLKEALTQLVAGLKARFELPADFSLNNIDIGLAPQGDADAMPRYLITVKVEPT